MSPWDALPEHIDEPSEWIGTDDWKNKWMRWRIKIKGWFAFGYRSKHWWARWRKYPIPFLCFGGDGLWRYECPGKEDMFLKHWDHVLEYEGYYLSRIQYLKRWNVIIQWPAFFAFHAYLNKDAMQVLNKRKAKDGIRNQINFYAGAMFDNDLVYWFPAITIGGTWK